MIQSTTDMLEQAYKLFNERNIDSLLLLMEKNVRWPNGWKGGYVLGHDAVRDYWTQQWNEINPIVTPISFVEKPDGKIEVEVRQVVKDLLGNLLSDGMVNHIYSIREGKIISMEIISR
jgi:hypothetical protein